MDVDVAGVVSDFNLQGLDQEPGLPWAIAPDLAEQLWHLSKKLTGVEFNTDL
jgi:hypothetical protein